MSKMALFFIRFYQLTLSAFVGSCCRFQPTCSEYAKQAIQEHGLFRGSYLAVRRILRCHPGCAGGYDPVPKK